jgi:small subunit ribosomal protein S6
MAARIRGPCRFQLPALRLSFQEVSDLRLYEGMFILNDARCTDDYNGTVAMVHNILNEYGVEVVDSRKWDERKLAYPIRRHRRGVYVLIHFNAPPEAIAPIERRLRLATDVVLRDLIVSDEDGISLGDEKETEEAAREARRAEAKPAEPAEQAKPEEEGEAAEAAMAEVEKEGIPVVEEDEEREEEERIPVAEEEEEGEEEIRVVEDDEEDEEEWGKEDEQDDQSGDAGDAEEERDETP